MLFVFISYDISNIYKNRLFSDYLVTIGTPRVYFGPVVFHRSWEWGCENTGEIVEHAKHVLVSSLFNILLHDSDALNFPKGMALST